MKLFGQPHLPFTLYIAVSLSRKRQHWELGFSNGGGFLGVEVFGMNGFECFLDVEMNSWVDRIDETAIIIVFVGVAG